MKIKIGDPIPHGIIVFQNKKQAKENFDLEYYDKDFDFVHHQGQIFVNKEGVKTEDDWRELGYNLIQYLNDLTMKTISLDQHPDKDVKIGPLLEGMILGDYRFTIYKSKPKKRKLKTIYVPTNLVDKKVVERAIARAEAQCFVRNIVNTTPEDMNSEDVLQQVRLVQSMSRGEPGGKGRSKLFVTAYHEDELKKLGMNGHLAVNRASRHPAMTIKVEYEPKNWDKHIVLVGKGLTYDSGGLDIKTDGYMRDMKSDKAGAITVLGIMKGIAEIGCKHKVTAYLGMAENMIDGSAYKADDVLTMKNGKTVHVKNTDAEGRIVLFDNICLAEEENPKFDEMYTFATLTGAAVYQFGAEATGMVGFNDKMKKVIKKVGKKEGEVFCDAEFHKFMLDGVDDSVADISNTGTKNQGCQKAGLFLTKALTKKGVKKYLHLDIAGPAWAESDWGTNKKGGTGYGVRTFLNYLEK